MATTLHLGAHHAGALQSLYVRRQNLLRGALTAADGVEALECRLSLHLATLAEARQEPAEPCKPKEVFGHVAAPLWRGDGTGDAAVLAFLRHGGDEAEAAGAAFTLFPPESADGVLVDAYSRHPELRPQLIQLWHRAGCRIPIELLNAAESTASSPALRIAALRYAADRPDIALDRFQAQYVGAQSTADTRLLTVALWGGLRRDDPLARRALYPALNAAEGTDEIADVLRLMALDGHSDSLEMLTANAERHPEIGLPLLGMAGKPQSMPTVLAALERPNAARVAAEAWLWLTGEPLPEQPRLREVNAHGPASPRAGDSLPDADWARGWWRQHGRRLAAAPRLLFGQVMTPTALVRACHQWSGQRLEDLLDLAALAVGPSFASHADHAVTRRRAALRATAIPAGPELPEGWQQLDAWELARHA